jgi:hypothetical protein
MDAVEERLNFTVRHVLVSDKQKTEAPATSKSETSMDKPVAMRCQANGYNKSGRSTWYSFYVKKER